MTPKKPIQILYRAGFGCSADTIGWFFMLTSLRYMSDEKRNLQHARYEDA